MASGRIATVAKRVAIGAGAATVLVGLLHTSAARPLLARIGGCPAQKATAADVEAGRRLGVQATRGALVAPARPALGFALEESSPEEVHAWAKQHHLACTDRREGMVITCKDVPSAALPSHAARATGPARPGEVIDEVVLAFRPTDRRLVNVTAASAGLARAEAGARMGEASAQLSSELGPPHTSAGAEGLAQGGGAQASKEATATVQYRYQDFLATVTATRIGDRGFVVREHYLSARD